MVDKKYDFDIALSYAGEDRLYVEDVYKLLQQHQVEVFYDQEEKGNLWGKNLYTSLSDLYQNGARYCVMFLSQHYVNKCWTNHEREAAQARAFQELQEYILPIKLDETKIPGLLSTVSYLSRPPETAETIVQFLLQKLYNSSSALVSTALSDSTDIPYIEQTTYIDRSDVSNLFEQYLHQGIAHYKEKRYKEALTACEKAFQLNSQCHLALIGKGHAHYQLRHYKKALSSYEQAISLNPTLIQSYLGKGKTLLQLGRLTDALVSFQHAVKNVQQRRLSAASEAALLGLISC